MQPIIPHPRPDAPRFAKVRRPFLDPIAQEKNAPRFLPPPPTNNVHLELPLEQIIPQQAAIAAQAGKLVFHVASDTGGVHGDQTELAVAEAMEARITAAQGADKSAFLYIGGDVVYYNGLSRDYVPQFYDPYKYYPGPIFAIAGNHDGDTKVQGNDPPDTEPTLFGFMQNFCAPQAEHLYSPYRATMTQPYVYWTLLAPLVTIIGLYSNVEGSLDARGGLEQQRWLQQQLQVAPQDTFLLVVVHHPPYSLDRTHGGSPDVVVALDRAFQAAKRYPHAVLSGHVHSMQRFTRRVSGLEIPYVVGGHGGYANDSRLIHKLQTDNQNHPPRKGVKTKSAFDPHLDLTVENYDQDNPGFLEITATADTLTIRNFAVPFSGAAVTQNDQVQVSKDHKVKQARARG
ncbi:MAG TPA: metallophosphoesterase [Acetobacteraceae bacterium]|nr:metallophosphoesterase [Acetobacteraceae bacterium]